MALLVSTSNRSTIDMAAASVGFLQGVIRVPEASRASSSRSVSISPIVHSQRSGDKRRNAVAVLERWWIRVRNRKLFSTIKHAICAAEHSLTREVLRKLSPREASLLTDPVLQPKVKFRLSGLQFPPVVVFKIYLSTHSHYISGRSLIRPASEAANDACRMMGNRKFYDQLLLDTCQHQQMKVTDPVDVTTVKDYMKYTACLDESPAYMGGRDNQWRRMALDSLPRHSQMYNVVDFLTRAHHPEMRGRSMEWIASLSRPPTQNEQIERITAVSSISPSSHLRTPSPRKPLITVSSPSDKSHSRGRQSRLAQQRVQKMRRAYSSSSNRDELAATENEKDDIDLEEQDAVDDLYRWSQELSLDELT